jgi:DNA-binding winged helix-turn-helix (wHTH) protein/TolB-like protein/cytochrome c-type biogenesis protein CcmH/NrfG
MGVTRDAAPLGDAEPPTAAAAAGAARWQVGAWTVEPALNQLSAAGQITRLEPKAMAVLVHLADRAGQVVSREALLASVWPGVVVGDDSLTQVVIKLRKALGDDPQQPTFIQTISKKGYRLIAPVVRLDGATPPGPRVVGAEPARRTPWLAGAVVAALVVAAGAVWWVVGSGDAIAVGQRQALGEGVQSADATQPSVAIRPFEALGDEPQTVLLARGITADLMTDLSKVFGVAVIGGPPIGGEVGSPMLAGSPGTRHLVSGSVQRIGDRLRVQVHLTDAQTGQQVWSERFDRPLGSFFAIQEELGPKILKMLPAKVTEAELRRVALRHTRNLEAYEEFQRGQAALLVRTRDENERARQMFRRAIELDAAFARAYAGLALTYAADYRNRWAADGAAVLARASELAQTAHQMNPDIAETYWVLAFVHVERRQHEQALQLLQTAVRLYPSFADGYALMGGVHTYTGQPAETVRLLRTAMRLNPQAGYLYFLLLGRAYLFVGDLEQARVNLNQAFARNPVNLETHVYLAALNALAGDQAAAAWEGQEIRALQPDFSIRGWLDNYPMTDETQRISLLRALGGAGL